MLREEHVKIFEFLDHDKNGHVLRFECFYKEAEPEEWVVRGVVSLEEFHTAVEAAAPVKSLEAGRESEGKPSEGGLPRESLSRDVSSLRICVGSGSLSATPP